MMFIVAVLFGVGVPVGFWLWRESRLKNPATRWPELAPYLEMKYLGDPPRIEGAWKGRTFRLTAEGEEALVITGANARKGIRVEIGPKEMVEKAAGMVVHDRVVLNDFNFEKRYLLRGTPPELGEQACDPSMRQRLMSLPDVHILALPDRVVVRVPFPTEASQIRNYLDLAGAVADSIDGQ